MSWQFATTCIGSNADLIGSMADAAQDLTYRTFRRLLGGPEMDEWSKAMLYDTGHERGGLRLKNDWRVSYHRSTYGGTPCLYIRHSAIEHIWVQV